LRIVAGVLVCVVTLLVTAILLFLSICFGLLMSNSPSSYGSDAPWIYALFVVTVVVPVGGTWLAVRLFRGAKRTGAAVAGAAAPVVFTPTVPPKEAEERLAYLRLVILVAILAHAAVFVLGLTRYRGTPYHLPLAPVILNFVLYEIPYVIVLIGIRDRAERWAISLACMYPFFAVLFTAFALLTRFAPWSRYSAMAGGLAILAHYLLSAAADVAVLIFAWRAWQAGRTSEDTIQLVVWGLASAFYLFVLRLLTPALYRLFHY
jgi:hypothetical protein